MFQVRVFGGYFKKSSTVFQVSSKIDECFEGDFKGVSRVSQRCSGSFRGVSRVFQESAMDI